ncbi:hypothetical protein BH10CHL1_BH10CHL1_09460 [soil metagenome]
MKKLQLQMSTCIPAPASLVYRISADYREGHPQILPAYFSDLVVEEGGFGAGTRIRFKMTALGKIQTFHALISEPEPGRVLVEDTGPEAGTVTTFTIDPIAQGEQAQVTIATELKSSGGIGGVIERFFTRMFLRRVYTQELKLLGEVAMRRQQMA